ncbi:MAG TPA: cation diffusion facilitator family transporter [Verrucomicrobiae bacterium]|nr:cation diffusion facilitator family transporter [Verrucomicrobiae bacterium]
MNHANEQKVNVAAVSVLSNTFLVVGKVIVGMLTGSISILSEAIHSAIDLVAAVIAYFSVKEASKPADDRHKYGHGKIENLSGTIEAILIVLAAIWIIYEAAGKLSHGGEVEQLGWGILVMGVSAVVNLAVSTRLMRVAKETDSVALEADALHLRTDVYTSLGVMIGLAGIKLTGIAILDPLAAMGVALLILKAGLDLTRHAFLPLVDISLPAEDEKVIVEVINSFSTDYLEFHKLRTRKSGSERHIDLHLVVQRDLPVYQVHTLCDCIETEIEQRLPRSHVLIHIEPCPKDCSQCNPPENHCPGNDQ